MRKLTLFGILTLTIVLLIPATAAAQQAPGGTYLQTCRDVGVRGSTLYATCQNTSSGWQSSELRDFQGCSSDIQNINGNLQCTMGSYGGYDRDRGGDRNRDRDHRGDNDRAPRGSYIQSCQNISVSGHTLQASCQKRNGNFRQTSLRSYNRCGDIVNNNGRLQCTR